MQEHAFKLPNENLESLYSTIKQYNNNTMLTAVNTIYVELSVIQDIYLGALLCLLKDESEYNYVLSGLSNYNSRYLLGCAQYFPDLKIEESELQKILEDPEHTLNIIRSSPMTKAFSQLGEFILMIHEHNRLVNARDKTLTIYLSTYPLKFSHEVYSKEMFITIGRELKNRVTWLQKNLKLNVTDVNPNELQFSTFKKMNAFFVRDFLTMLGKENSDKADWVTQDGKLENGFVRAMPIMEKDEYDNLVNLKYEKNMFDSVVANGKRIMSLVTNFDYITPIIEVAPE